MSTHRVLATCLFVSVGAATLAARQHTGSPLAAQSTPAKPATAKEQAAASKPVTPAAAHPAEPSAAKTAATAAKHGADPAVASGKAPSKASDKTTATADAHAAAPATSHASEQAAHGSPGKPADPAGHDAGPPSNKAPAGSLSDVKTAVARIQQRVLEVMVPKPTAQGGRGGRASGSGAAALPPTPRPPSVQLTWRTPLGWPVDLVGDPGVPTADRAVQLTWE